MEHKLAWGPGGCHRAPGGVQGRAPRNSEVLDIWIQSDGPIWRPFGNTIRLYINRKLMEVIAKSNTFYPKYQYINYYIPHRKIPVIWLVKRAGIILLCPLKWLCPGHSQSELGACYVPRVKITSTHTSMSSRGNYATIASCRHRSH